MSTAVRIVVPNGDVVLAAPNGLAGWQLPRVPLAWSAAWQAADVETAGRIAGGAVAPVRRIDSGAWEMVARDRLGATASHWVGLDELGRLGSDERIVRSWLDLPAPVAFERSTWHDEIEAWVGRAIAPVTGRGRPLRHWELSAVTQLDTSAGPVVAKENRRGFHREGDVLDALRGIDGVPDLLALDGPRLVTPLAAGTSPSAQDNLLRVLGRVHRAAVDRVAALPHLWETPATTDADRAALAAVDALGIPATVIHGDAHQGNLLVDDNGVATLIDWTDAHVANPLLDCRMGLVDHEDDPRALDAWLESWEDIVDPAAIRAAIPSIALAGSLTIAEFYRRGFADTPTTMHEEWRTFERFWLDRVAADRARIAVAGR